MNRKVFLMYHDVVTPGNSSSGFQNDSAFQYKVEARKFEAQVKALADRDDIVFTFDDGGVSFHTIAAPILEKYGLRGVFFVSTKYIGTPGFLTAVQIKDLADRGHEVGSHSHTHPHNFAQLSREEMRDEWKSSFSILTDLLGCETLTVSIPHGYSSKMVLEEAIKCGYSDIYTSQPTTKIKHFRGHRIIGRYVVHDGMSTQDVVRIVNNKSNRLKLSMKWHLLNLAKAVLGSSYDKVKATIIHH